MKISTQVGSFKIEVEGNSLEEAVNQIAEASELFTHGLKDEKTGCPDVIIRKRTAGEYEFYEFLSADGNTLSLGRTKAGGFYPRRKDKDGNWLDHKGWMNWQDRKSAQPQEEQEPF